MTGLPWDADDPAHAQCYLSCCVHLLPSSLAGLLACSSLSQDPCISAAAWWTHWYPYWHSPHPAPGVQSKRVSVLDFWCKVSSFNTYQYGISVLGIWCKVLHLNTFRIPVINKLGFRLTIFPRIWIYILTTGSEKKQTFGVSMKWATVDTESTGFWNIIYSQNK